MEDIGTRIHKIVEQARKQALERLDALPYVKALRSFWSDLNAMREWWPVLIPLLTFIGWRTYQNERRQVEQEKRKAAPVPAPTLQTQSHSTVQHAAIIPPTATPQLPPGSHASVIIHRSTDE